MKKFAVLFLFAILVTFPLAAQFPYITNLNPEPAYKNTGEKPQSKLWNHDGKWWAVFNNTTGTYIWRLDGTSWTNVLKISSSKATKADCKKVGNITHIFLFRDVPNASQLVSVEYVPASHTYKLWTNRTSTTYVLLDDESETATMDIDGNGRMWVASDGFGDINVRWSDPPYTAFSSSINLATGITNDDICLVISLPASGKMGVLWSNQNSKRFGFKTHTDGANPSDWSSDEVPASQSALDVGGGMSDDHMNMAVASDGTLYCAVKTSYDTPGYPRLSLLVRRPNGVWDNLYQVSPSGSRSIVLLNESINKLRIIYSSVEDGGDILYRESSTSNIAFGTPLTLMRGTFNNATSSKDNYSSDVVILASIGNNNTNIVGVLAGNIPPPQPPGVPTLVSPEDLSTGVPINPTLSWNAAPASTSYQVQVSTLSDFSTTAFNENNIETTSVQVTGLTNDTKFYWRVRSANGPIFSDWSSVRSFTTVIASTNSNLVGRWKMDESSGTSLLDNSIYDNKGTTTGNPARVAGISGLALKLNGSTQYATVPDAASLDISGDITLAAWIRPEKMASQVIIKKGLTGIADGYELALTSTGKVFFRFNQVSSSDYDLNSKTLYPDDGNTWMHVAATYDGSTIKIYINGIKDKSITFSAPPPININEINLGIGAQSSGSNKFKGTIDEVHIYNTALSSSEIMDLATNAQPANAKIMASAPNTKKANATSKEPAANSQSANTDDILSKNIQVYPNPVDDLIYLEFSEALDKNTSLLILDQTGRIYFQKNSILESDKLEVDVSTLNISPGIYLLQINSPGYKKVVRFIKK